MREAEIIEPKAASELLDLAVDRARKRQRLIYFCACEYPGTPRQPGCHRTLVTELVLREAGGEDWRSGSVSGREGALAP